jgi:TetR/AcrR family transcriptional regulator, cholesterol catabolism regulator
VTVTALDPADLPRGQRARRDRIVAAAIDLLRHDEYDMIQMRQVAEAAQVALATIYRYFSSKEHLYAAALMAWAEAFPPDATPLRGADTDEARLRALMRRAVRAFERNPQMMRAEIVIEHSHDPNARVLFDEFGRRNIAALRTALASSDPARAAAIIETVNAVMVTRLRSWALGRCTIRDVDRSVQNAIELIFDQ